MENWLVKYAFLVQIGYRPFVEACIDADEKVEALKYIPKLADPREKAEVNWIFLMHLPPIVADFHHLHSKCGMDLYIIP